MNRLFVPILLSLALSAASGVAVSQESSAEAESREGLAAQTEELVTAVRDGQAEAEELITRYETAEGEDQLLLRSQLRRIGERLSEMLEDLVGHIGELEVAGVDADAARDAAVSLLDAAEGFLRNDVTRVRDLIATIRANRSESPDDELLDREQELNVAYQGYDELLRNLLRIVGHRETLGLDVSAKREELGQILVEHAEELGAETGLTLRLRDDLRSRSRRSTDEVEQAAINNQRAAVRERLHYLTTSLEETTTLMDNLGLDTAQYRDLLIRATGNVTVDILDPDVAASLIGTLWQQGKVWLASNVPQFVFKSVLFIAILAFSYLLAQLSKKTTLRAMSRPDQDVPQLFKNVAVSAVSKGVMLIGILVALSQIGIEITPLLTGLGVAGFIAGFALQETLSNFAAGLMLLFYHPFDVGDVVEAGGVSGTVETMNLVSTTMLTFDNEELVIPNKKIWGDVIRNKTARPIRRVDLEFSISYEDDMEKARDLIRDVVTSHELVLDDPEPLIRLDELADSSVNFIARPWVATRDYWTVHWDLIWAVKARFDREGIAIPYPQRDVHVHTHTTPSEGDERSSPRRRAVTTDRQGGAAGLEDESD